MPQNPCHDHAVLTVVDAAILEIDRLPNAITLAGDDEFVAHFLEKPSEEIHGRFPVLAVCEVSTGNDLVNTQRLHRDKLTGLI